jgi:hypothetical protein
VKPSRYDVSICNFLGQPYQWLREIADQEHEHDALAASVYSSAAPTLVKVERTSASTTITAVDRDSLTGPVEGVAGQVLSPYAKARLGL